MNPSIKASYDKINMYRQKIKQNIISEQNGYLLAKQPMTPRQTQTYPKIQSTLSRSNIRKNHLDVSPSFGNFQQSDDQNLNSQRSNKNKISQQPQHIDQIKNYDQKIIDNRNLQHPKVQEQRTIQKPSTSKSPSNKHPYLNQRDIMTKRKTAGNETERSSTKTGTRQQGLTNFSNPSSFDAFGQKPINNSVLPPLFGQIGNQNITTNQQVKILLQQNQIISLHLNQKMQRIRMLERQLKQLSKSGIKNQQKYGMEVSQMAAQNEMIKKSTDQQVKTLVMEVKKLNQELVQKEDEWQERLNKVRKVNLQEQQQMKKNQFKIDEKHSKQIQELRIQINTVNQDFKKSKDQASKIIQKLKQQKQALTQSIQKLTHLHKMQKSQLGLTHDIALKETKQEYYRKNEIINLDRIKKQNEMNNTIEQLRKEIAKLNDQLDNLKQQKDLTQIKDMQQRGKLLIQLRQEKQKAQQLKLQENQKLSKISNAQMQNSVNSYETLVSQLKRTISNLQNLLEGRNTQIKNLYKEINDMRKNYHLQLGQKQQHIKNLNNKIDQITQQNMQQQQCLKIKLSGLIHTNQSTIQQLYEKQLGEMKHLLIDKDEVIRSLREKIGNQLLEIDQKNLMHHQEAEQLHTKIQKLQQQLTANALKQKNNNANFDKENAILKQNILRQSEAYQKAINVKEENIKRLQKIIETKDKEIEQLQNKIQLLKKTNKDEVAAMKDEYQSQIRQKDDKLTELKAELQYARKQQSKRAEQFSHDKQYYSNQLRELKNKGQQDFNEWVETLSQQINNLKMENKDLKHDLNQMAEEYQQYRALWNQKDTLQKIKEGQKEFIERLNNAFTVKYQKIIEGHEREIQQNYKPKINTLNQIISQKDQQILDMKTNYHDLQMKFEKLMDDKENMQQINQKILQLGKDNSNIVGNFVTLGR